jgi:hypothetical protein
MNVPAGPMLSSLPGLVGLRGTAPTGQGGPPTRSYRRGRVASSDGTSLPNRLPRTAGGSGPTSSSLITRAAGRSIRVMRNVQA